MKVRKKQEEISWIVLAHLKNIVKCLNKNKAGDQREREGGREKGEGEREREREDTNKLSWLPHNSMIVHSPCTSKRFFIIIRQDYNCVIYKLNISLSHTTGLIHSEFDTRFCTCLHYRT